ncbi:MAG: hypothetical protein JEZ07_06095 [Phycisphaerae bacterium]|nr:hypothetical protein [Phycisphaerae bacterium]
MKNISLLLALVMLFGIPALAEDSSDWPLVEPSLTGNHSSYEFGSAVATDGKTIVVSDPTSIVAGEDFAGRIFIFDNYNGFAWDKMVFSSIEPIDSGKFGASIHIDGNYIVVGEYNGQLAYIFEKIDSDDDGETDQWTSPKLIQRKTTDDHQVDGCDFGQIVAIYNPADDSPAGDKADTLVAIGDTDYIQTNVTNSDGAVFIFKKDEEQSDVHLQWQQQIMVVPSDSDEGGAETNFGAAIDIDGDYLIVGRPNFDSTVDKYDEKLAVGRAYIYERQSDDSWEETILISPNLGNDPNDTLYYEEFDYFDYGDDPEGNIGENEFFGAAVAIAGDIAAVSAYNDGIYGAVYIYKRQSGGSWQLVDQDDTVEEVQVVRGTETQTNLGKSLDLAKNEDGTYTLIAGHFRGVNVYNLDADGVASEPEALDDSGSSSYFGNYNGMIAVEDKIIVVGDYNVQKAFVFGMVPLAYTIDADFNSSIDPNEYLPDGNVDLYDFYALSNEWLIESGFDEKADLNNDGTIDVDDLVILVSNWLFKAEPPAYQDFTESFESQDFTSNKWSLEGTELWTIESDGSAGSYSAKSPAKGKLTDSQGSRISIMLDVQANRISFDYKVSSELNYDGLAFYVDGILKGFFTGDVDEWTEQKYEIEPGEHIFCWQYLKDEVDIDDVGDDCAWVDNIQFSTIEYPEHLFEDFETGDFTKYAWDLSGDKNWTIVDISSENKAARSGLVPGDDEQESVITITTTVPEGYNKITFDYKVASEYDFDELIFYVDDTPKAIYSGVQGWSNATFDITEGTHTFSWKYIKDESEYYSDDAAWIDNVKIYKWEL